jgi:transcriptional regulator NrdR family protein
MPFSRDKLFLSLYRSLQHRKTAVDDAAALTETVIKKVSASVTDGVIKASAVTAAAQVALNRFDKAASIHYQAFHA